MRWSWKRPSIPKKYQQWLNENYWWMLILLALVAAIAFHLNNWAEWVGFNDKKLWDWFQLLGVPLSLAILGYILQRQQQKRAEQLSREQRELAAEEATRLREIAADEEREEILQTYFDRLSTLLVDKNILAIATKTQPSEEERELLDASVDVIRARTLSILRRFEGDVERKGSVIRFLSESEVIGKAKLSLSKANLEGANLEGINLEGANLEKANLRRANLLRANLSKANLNGAKLEEVKLGGGNLYGAKLEGAKLKGAYLYSVRLRGASLYIANLKFVNLNGAFLEGAVLNGASLEGAVLDGATLYGTRLLATSLLNIRWNEFTTWPDPREVAKAENIPDELKQQLEINAPPTPEN